MQNQLYKTTLALAGIVQTVFLVKELAQSGKTDEAAFQASLYSIFQTDPSDLSAIYGGIAGVKFGLEKLITLLEPTTSPLQVRYMLSIMRLQKKIFRSKKTVAALSLRISQAKKQVDYFSLTHATVLANLADIYLSTIKPFKYRIVVWGSQRILSSSDVMEKIRALLLAGIRSSHLWRQLGGSRLQLLFSRQKIKNMARDILADLPYEQPAQSGQQ